MHVRAIICTTGSRRHSQQSVHGEFVFETELITGREATRIISPPKHVSKKMCCIPG